jgi:hypothetical protein
MTNGEKVFVNMAFGSLLRGTFINEFWNPRDAEYFATVMLDRPYAVHSSVFSENQTIEFVNVRLASVKRAESDGVKLTFPLVKWAYNGHTREFSMSDTKARAFSAMAHVDKLQAIKSFRADFGGESITVNCPLKAAKDVIERLMSEFPAR